MIPVTQTRRGGPDVPPAERGDCFDACLASILEVSIDQVHVPHVDDWWDEAQQAVMAHGYHLVYLAAGPAPARDIGGWLGPVYWIASVPSLNLGTDAEGRAIPHSLVMRGVEIVHDPSLGRRYPLGDAPEDLAIAEAILLVALEPKAVDPAAAARRARRGRAERALLSETSA